jgi:hypothetical protein
VQVRHVCGKILKQCCNSLLPVRLDVLCVSATGALVRQRVLNVLTVRYVTFQMAEVAVPKQMFREILSLIVRLRAPPARA